MCRDTIFTISLLFPYKYIWRDSVIVYTVETIRVIITTAAGGIVSFPTRTSTFYAFYALIKKRQVHATSA